MIQTVYPAIIYSAVLPVILRVKNTKLQKTVSGDSSYLLLSACQLTKDIYEKVLFSYK